MQTRPRLAVLISLFTALMTALVLTSGCSSDKKNDEPAARRSDAAEAVAATPPRRSRACTWSSTVTGKIKKLPITQLTGDLTNTPAVAASGKANITALGTEAGRRVDSSSSTATLYADASPRAAGPTSVPPPTSTTSRRSSTRTRAWPTSWPTSPTRRPSRSRVDQRRRRGQDHRQGHRGRRQRHRPADSQATGPVPGTAWIREDGDHELVQAKLEPTPRATPSR